MKKLSIFLGLFLLTGCAGVQKKQQKEPEKTREEIIDEKLKQVLAIAETSLEISKKSENMSKQASEKSISVANQTIAEVNRLRATVKMKPEEEPIIIKEPEVQKKYTIKKGDTLSKIAKKFYGNANKWREIYQKNKKVIKNPNILIPGTEIVIP